MKRNNVKFTFDEVKNFVEVESDSGCKLLSKEYVRANDSMDFQCVCGNIFNTTFSKFKNTNKRQCNECSLLQRADKRSKTTFDFIREVYNLVGEEYTILSEYKTTHENVEIIHNDCGFKYSVSPANFLSGKRCPNCNKGVLKSHTKFKSEFDSVSNNEYKLLSRYKNNNTKIKVMHNDCKFVYDVLPYSFLQGNKCPLCSGRYKDTDIFKEEVELLVGDEFEVLGEYVLATEKVKFKHLKCGKTFKMRPNDFKNGQRCPHCKKSKGEKVIYDILTRENVNFKEQYRIKECRNIYPLPFDFAIFNKNGNLECLIEYQGRQHYDPIRYRENGSYSNLEYIQRNDKIKFDFCKDNGIELIIVPYWDFNNIENILNEYIKQIA